MTVFTCNYFHSEKPLRTLKIFMDYQLRHNVRVKLFKSITISVYIDSKNKMIQVNKVTSYKMHQSKNINLNEINISYLHPGVPISPKSMSHAPLTKELLLSLQKSSASKIRIRKIIVHIQLAWSVPCFP